MTFLSLKNDVNVPSKSNKQKTLAQKIFFVAVLKVKDENSRIRIHWSRTTSLVADPDSDPTYYSELYYYILKFNVGGIGSCDSPDLE
jgi:hypothetical protein